MVPSWNGRTPLVSAVDGGGWDSVGEARRPGGKPLMPNAAKCYGLQHFASVLNVDTHEELEYFDTFYEQLKNAEGLLKITERRERFVWTCIRGTAFDQHPGVKLILGFSGSLYDKKWK